MIDTMFPASPPGNPKGDCGCPSRRRKRIRCLIKSVERHHVTVRTHPVRMWIRRRRHRHAGPGGDLSHLGSREGDRVPMESVRDVHDDGRGRSQLGCRDDGDVRPFVIRRHGPTTLPAAFVGLGVWGLVGPAASHPETRAAASSTAERTVLNCGRSASSRGV